MIAQKLERYRYVERKVFVGEAILLKEIHLYHHNYIYLIEDGSIEYQAADGQTYQAGKYDLVPLNKGTRCIRRVLSPVHLHIFEIKHPLNIVNAPIPVTDLTRVRSDLELLHQNYTDIVNNFEHIKHLLRDILYSYGLNQQTDLHHICDERIVQAQKIMHQNFTSGIKIKEIAETLYLSYPHFVRLFVENIQMTPTKYLNRLKLEKAKMLLDTTNLLMKEIAEQCGFQNVYYFSNFFKKEIGISPTEYRKLDVPM